MLAITQPIRIGDLVTFEEETGEVEDVRLTYTYIRLDDGRRLDRPERACSPRARSRTTRSSTRACRWRCRSGCRPDADLDRAIELITRRGEGDLGDGGRDRQGGRPAQRHELDGEPARARQGGRRAAPPLAASAQRARSILRRSLLADEPSAAKDQEAQAPRRGSKVLLGLGVVATVCVIGVLSAAGYVLAIAASAPDLSELKADDKGQLSVVFAADGTQARLHPVGHPAAGRPVGGHPRRDAPRHRRDRGRALLQARGRRPQRDRPRRHQEPRVRRDRAGRLDDHPAAGPRALHQGPRAQLRAQDPRGQARLGARGGALQDLDPPRLPELGPVRHGPGAHLDRRRRRRR